MALRFLLFLSLLMLASCRKTIDANGLKVELEAQKLSNGLTVIMIEDHSVPLISYQTWLRVGSVDDETGKTGLAHLFERMMFKGTSKFGPRDYFGRIEAKGGNIRAHSTRDYMMFQNTVPAALLDSVIELESDRLMGLKITQDVLQSDVLLGLEERKLQSDSIPGKMNEALWGLAYRRHPYRWPVMGYPQDLISLTVEDVQEFYKKYFTPVNTTIVLTGDFSSESVLEKIKKAYGLFPKREKPKRELTTETGQEEERRLVIRENTVSERFSHAYHIPQAGESDTHALDVLSSVLFEGPKARFPTELSKKESVMLDIQGAAFTPVYPGLFLIQAVLKKGVSAETGEEKVAEVLREIQEKGVSEEEVRRAVQQMSLDMLKGLRTVSGLGQLVGTVMMVFDDPGEFEADLQKYSKVKPEDVKRVAAKYFYPNNRSVVILKAKPEGAKP